jgi:Arc/MetJ-type ribon-helix-helix transcriptional regulator
MNNTAEDRPRQKDLEMKDLVEESIRLKRKRMRGEGGVGEGVSQAMSTRFTEHQIEFLNEIVRRSNFDNKSEYIRQAALGLDNKPDICSRSAVVIRWVRHHQGKEIKADQWEELADLVNKIFGGGGRQEEEGGSQEELSDILKTIEKHLLGVKEERLEEETGLKEPAAV